MLWMAIFAHALLDMATRAIHRYALNCRRRTNTPQYRRLKFPQFDR
jgi:hypothetical protein